MSQLKRLVAGFPPRRPGFDPRSGHVGFVDKVALGQDFSEYFGFTCQSSFHQLLHNQHRSSRAGTIGQQWPHPEKPIHYIWSENGREHARNNRQLLYVLTISRFDKVHLKILYTSMTSEGENDITRIYDVGHCSLSSVYLRHTQRCEKWIHFCHQI
jgi:hypothetical protein